MQRRSFIKLSSLVVLPLIAGCHLGSREEILFNFDIELMSDHETGHLVRNAYRFPKKMMPAKKWMIAGGGIAGMAAASMLKNEDMVLFELSEKLGGSSGALEWQQNFFAQGAHYDLAYPEYYGADVLNFLKNLGLIYHDKKAKHWNFTDQQHLISPSRESLCFADKEYRSDVLPDGPLQRNFLKLLHRQEGKMPMPTRIINAELHHLNEIDFLSYLRKHFNLTPKFVRAIDYHMRDDYGANAKDVSALAGIHYYMCRPYYKENVPLFSPPEGNYYFIKKMAAQINSEKIHTGHIVSNIKKENDRWLAEVIDVKNQIVNVYPCQNIIYAGHKHALKHIYPEGYKHFKSTTYSPWLVINFILKNNTLDTAFWQNEFVDEDIRFLGFIDSYAQSQQANAPRVLTAYYCFDPEHRSQLLEMDRYAKPLIKSTIEAMNLRFEKDINPLIEKAYIKLMGHAMPIPSPNYLLQNTPVENNITYAGVDCFRLPLLFEALDSGIQAVAKLKNKTKDTFLF